MSDLKLDEGHVARIEPSFGESQWYIYHPDGYIVAMVPVKLFHENRKPADFLNLLIEQKNLSFQKGIMFGYESAQRAMRKAIGVES